MVWKAGASRSEIGLFCDGLAGFTFACRNTEFGINVTVIAYYTNM